MIRVYIYQDGRLTTIDGAGGVSTPGADARVWVEAVAPTSSEVAALVALLGLHELSLEDALAEGHPPKLEEFEDHLFLIVHTPTAEGETRKIAIFVAKTWIVTVERTELSALDPLTKRVEKEPKRFLSSPDRLAHALLDFMSEGFEHHVDELRERAEQLECNALEVAQRETLMKILDLRAEVSDLARTVRSQRDVCGALARTVHPAISKKLQPYLRDVYDHVLRVHDGVDGVREQLAAARDAHLITTNNRLSDIMRVLTGIATVVLPLTLISGVFGMNFENIPGLRSPHGFWLALACMVTVALLLLAWFRRRGWF
ncbi:MAG: magnesium/cobalt transporter CorA [Planctomycetota bacterium]